MKLYHYQPSTEADIMMLDWWARMGREGELDYIIHPSVQNPLAFLTEMAKSRLWLLVEDNSIEAAVWFDPIFDSYFMGGWVAPERRGELTTLAEVRRIIVRFLTQTETETVLALTVRPELLDFHQRLGYRIISEIAGVWHGKTMWFMQATTAELSIIHGQES